VRARDYKREERESERASERKRVSELETRRRGDGGRASKRELELEILVGGIPEEEAA
jgi:hypothetical protein